jgi:hypothetical protein
MRMRGTFGRARAALGAAAVAGALAFGAASALADAPRAAVACRDPLANGACTTDAGCASLCQGFFGYATGNCAESRNCCYCRN